MDSETAQKYWDEEAATFDQETDHGLRDPIARAAWTRLLISWLPSEPAEILDIGCGTGSLSVVMAELEHNVSGIDLSPKMIEKAQAKAHRAEVAISFQVIEASEPDFGAAQFDGIVCRHLLWTLPNLSDVLNRWVRLLKPNGRLLFVEGQWHTGGGVSVDDILTALPAQIANVSVQDLSGDAAYWGCEVNDERYAISGILVKFHE